MPLLARYEPQIYALFRIVFGFLFLWHGVQKLFGWPPSSHGTPPAFVTWIAGPVELVGGLLVMVGLFAGWAAFVSSGLMAVAYFMAHQPQGLLPVQNQGEMAVLYCFAFLYIAARGSGAWSIDAVREPSGARVTVEVKDNRGRATAR
jgi:putative oxidoreductase